MARKKFRNANPWLSPPQKQPRVQANPESAAGLSPAWQISTLDRGGEFGWDKVVERQVLDGIVEKLRNFESMTWIQIQQAERHKSHNVPISQLCTEARRRLQEIRRDDIDELFSLRLTGPNRVWGIKTHNVLQLLWWDPDHKVCPSLR